MNEKYNSKLAIVVKEWNAGGALLSSVMDIVYDGVQVIEARGESLVRSELIITSRDESEDFIEKLWTRIRANVQTPLYATRDHRAHTNVVTDDEQVTYTSRTIDWFTLQDTMENLEKLLAIEDIIADALSRIKENVTRYVERNEPIPNTAWDVF